MNKLLLLTLVPLAACMPSSLDSDDTNRDSKTAIAPTGKAFSMGALLVDGGATVRVWAPNASAVSVVGDFGTQPLLAVGDGTYSGFIAGAAAGQAYRYAIENDGQTLVRADPRAPLIGSDPGQREPMSYFYDQKAYAWQSAPFVAPTPRHEVIYELHVGTFVDPTGTGKGTYQSAATKLADLAQLGINMVELLPVAEFPGSYSWGYNPVYPFAPAEAYGSPDDLKAFIDQAHQLGIGVILDVVFNHFDVDSSTTPSLSMWCFDGACDGGGIFFSPEPATPWGPRPAFGVDQVHDLIVDAIASWQVNYRVDGFRWDSVIAIRDTSLDGNGTQIAEGARILKDANVAIHARNPNAVTIAEDLQGWSAITQPVDAGVIEDYDSGFGFDTQWDNGFFFDVKAQLTPGSDSARDVTQLVSPLTSGVAMQRVVYTEDHDKVATQNGPTNQRIPELIGMSDDGYYAEKRSSLGIALVLTAPYTPMLFMGQEFLETLTFPFSAGKAIDWSNEQTYGGFRSLVHDLIALREDASQTTHGLTGNNIEILQAENSHDGKVSPAIAYHRWAQGGVGDDVVVVANFSNQTLALPVGLPWPGTWHVRLNSDDQAYSPAFGGTPSTDVEATGPALDNQHQSGTVNVGPYSVVILSQ